MTTRNIPPFEIRMYCKSLFVHFVFENVTDVEVCVIDGKPERGITLLENIDPSTLETDRIRPYPKWPMICKHSNHPAFETEKNAKAWADSNFMSVYKIWKCPMCGKFHCKCFPLEPSGSTSGKANRKWDFYRNQGAEVNYE